MDSSGFIKALFQMLIVRAQAPTKIQYSMLHGFLYDFDWACLRAWAGERQSFWKKSKES